MLLQKTKRHWYDRLLGGIVGAYDGVWESTNGGWCAGVP